LTAISLSAVGPRPSRSFTRSVSPFQFSPMRGGPNVVTTLPSRPMTRAPSADAEAVAEATPGTARTWSRTAAGMFVGTDSPSNSSIATFGLAETPTSVPE
jgi:hypothetical protein